MATEITSLRRRFSPQDSIFYYLETDQAPMTIGSIAVFEGHVPFRRFSQNIESKLHQIPRCMQKVVETPFNFTRPTWELDPNFDIRRHINRITLPAPGTDEQLNELAERLFRGRLDRSKPLWDLHFVEGLEGGRTGLISRVHHCLVDGVGGVELLMVTLDPTPETRAPTRILHKPEPAPMSTTAQVIDGVADMASEAVDLGASILRWLTDVFTCDFASTRVGMRALNTTLKYLGDPGKELPFNRDFSGGRKIAHMEIPFTEVREIRRAIGGTLNDVVLAVLGGALRRYTDYHGQPIATARVMTPVNVRAETERGMLGNRISMLIVEVPLGASAPVERLHKINERTKALKEGHVADGVAVIGQALATLPLPTLIAVGNTMTMGNGLGNIVCTNVPGPMIPLYTVGHRMLAHYPIMPIGWNMGIGCAVMSYDQQLFVTFVADAAAGPDVAVLARFMEEAYTELRAAADVPLAEEIPAPVPDKHTSILAA
jgi:diacylglycerol O-acyltransferase / wax synthase